MRDLLFNLIDLAISRGAAYADVRLAEEREERIAVRNGEVEAMVPGQSRGLGVRALVEGAWGFASASSPDDQDAERAVADAVALARAAANVNVRERRVRLVPRAEVRAHYRSHNEPNAYLARRDEKLALLLAADRQLRAQRGVTLAESSLLTVWEQKTFASSEGSFIEQELMACGAAVAATAIRGNDVQRRSWGDYASRGWPFIAELALEENASRVAAESVALLDGAPCPDTTTDVVIGASQMALQVHESCGHPTELDRALGSEVAFAGASFLTPDKLGSFRYGSELVNITADASLPFGLGSFGFDDEGTPAGPTPLVRSGVFTGYLTSRETAQWLRDHEHAAAGESNGAMRASSWARVPLIRMTNVNLEPNSGSLDQLLAGVDRGIYMEGSRSWSLDDLRLNFHFTCEIAWEIVGGRRGRLLKNPTYTGITPAFWRSCDGIASRAEWRVWGLPSCAKGEPVQIVNVAHGAAPARFRGVRVGI